MGAVLYSLANHINDSMEEKTKLIFIIASIAIISFLMGIYTLNNLSSSSAFYLPFNRFWELMIGSLLASIYAKKEICIKNIYINITGFIGLALLASSFILIDQYKEFPGLWALLPTTGTFLIILSQGSLINKYVLCNKILVYIGLISYPLYLWHWSLLSFTHILKMSEITDGIIILIISFILSFITYNFLEKRIKTTPNARMKLTIALAFTIYSWG